MTDKFFQPIIHNGNLTAIIDLHFCDTRRVNPRCVSYLINNALENGKTPQDALTFARAKAEAEEDLFPFQNNTPATLWNSIADAIEFALRETEGFTFFQDGGNLYFSNLPQGEDLLVVEMGDSRSNEIQTDFNTLRNLLVNTGKNFQVFRNGNLVAISTDNTLDWVENGVRYYQNIQHSWISANEPCPEGHL